MPKKKSKKKQPLTDDALVAPDLPKREATTVEDKVHFGTPFPEVTAEAKPASVEEKLPKGMVKAKVLVGTLMWEGGKYEKGETFVVSRKRFKLFDAKDVEIVS